MFAKRMKVADALMTLGSFVGIVRLTDAVDAASVPVSDAEAELVGPTRPTAVTVTGVPGGTLDAATATVTGFVVLAGNVMSGLEKEALGEVVNDWSGARIGGLAQADQAFVRVHADEDERWVGVGTVDGLDGGDAHTRRVADRNHVSALASVRR